MFVIALVVTSSLTNSQTFLEAPAQAGGGGDVVLACAPGQVSCAGGCIPDGTVCCGVATNGSGLPVYCPAGNSCSADGTPPYGWSCNGGGGGSCGAGQVECGNGCIPSGSVCCDTYYCPAGNSCGGNNTCRSNTNPTNPSTTLTCDAGQTPVDVTCTNGQADACGCSDSCSVGSDCESGCCSQGHCMLACVCAGAGSYTIDNTCGTGGGGYNYDDSAYDPAFKGCSSGGNGAGLLMLALGAIFVASRKRAK